MQLTRAQKYALGNVWQQIGADILMCSETDELPRDDVIELVLDADRPATFFPDIDWTEFNSLPYTEQVEVCRNQVFENESYTW